jgi:hypothetical protein
MMSRAHIHKGANKQLTEKHRGARQGRTGPKRAWAGRPGLFQARFAPPFALGARLLIASASTGCHIHPFIREPPTRGEAPGGSRRAPQVLELPRRGPIPCPSHHGWPCVVKPWWSSGAHALIPSRQLYILHSMVM